MFQAQIFNCGSIFWSKRVYIILAPKSRFVPDDYNIALRERNISSLQAIWYCPVDARLKLSSQQGRPGDKMGHYLLPNDHFFQIFQDFVIMSKSLARWSSGHKILPDLSFSESEASRCYLIDLGLSGHVPGADFQLRIDFPVQAYIY